MLSKTLIGVSVLTIMATTFVCVSMAKNEPVTDGLVSYWTFDEADIRGKTAKDVWGKNDGTIKGDPQIVAGKVGKALKFDGKADFIEVPDDDSLDIVEEITVEAWVKPGQAAGYGCTFRTITAKDIHASQPYGFYWDSANGELEFVLSNTAKRLTVAYNYDAKVGKWVHVAATYDTSQIKIYADGELIGTASYTSELPKDDAPLRIGHDGDCDRYFPGIIDELRIYNRGLTEAEILQNLASEGLAVEASYKLTLTWGEIKISR